VQYVNESQYGVLYICTCYICTLVLSIFSITFHCSVHFLYCNVITKLIVFVIAVYAVVLFLSYTVWFVGISQCFCFIH